MLMVLLYLIKFNKLDVFPFISYKYSYRDCRNKKIGGRCIQLYRFLAKTKTLCSRKSRNGVFTLFSPDVESYKTRASFIKLNHGAFMCLMSTFIFSYDTYQRRSLRVKILSHKLIAPMKK